MADSSGRDESNVVLADGGSAHLRALRTDDLDAVQRLYESLSDESRRLRFLGPMSTASAAVNGPDGEIDGRRFALVAETGRGVVGVADWYRTADHRAEVAFTVLDEEQHRGIGSLLLEHLADAAVAARDHDLPRLGVVEQCADAPGVHRRRIPGGVAPRP